VKGELHFALVIDDRVDGVVRLAGQRELGLLFAPREPAVGRADRSQLASFGTVDEVDAQRIIGQADELGLVCR
jgi:hypothetical protein